MIDAHTGHIEDRDLVELLYLLSESNKNYGFLGKKGQDELQLKAYAYAASANDSGAFVHSAIAAGIDSVPVPSWARFTLRFELSLINNKLGQSP